MSRQQVRTPVLRYYQEHPGQEIPGSEVASVCGLKDSSVSGALTALAEDPTSGIRRVRHGVYQYIPQREPVITPGEVFEFVGIAGSMIPEGARCVRDEKGVLYPLG